MRVPSDLNFKIIFTDEKERTVSNRNEIVTKLAGENRTTQGVRIGNLLEDKNKKYIQHC